MTHTYSVREEIKSLGGEVLYSSSDPEEHKRNNGKVYQFLAEFPYEEEFESQVIERLEDFISRHSLKREKDKVFLFFDIY